MTHRVKRLIVAQSLADADVGSAYKQMRNDLGEAFGTRKAKTRIRAEERNRVDVGAMEGAKGHLMASIEGKAPVTGECSFSLIQQLGRELTRAETPVASETIPVPNLATDNPLNVYSRQALIPDDEYSAISVSAIIQAPDDRSRSQLLPWSRGRWLEAKMKSIIAGPKDERKPKL